jgi:hypothetical protein
LAKCVNNSVHVLINASELKSESLTGLDKYKETAPNGKSRDKEDNIHRIGDSK